MQYTLGNSNKTSGIRCKRRDGMCAEKGVYFQRPSKLVHIFPFRQLTYLQLFCRLRTFRRKLNMLQHAVFVYIEREIIICLPSALYQPYFLVCSLSTWLLLTSYRRVLPSDSPLYTAASHSSSLSFVQLGRPFQVLYNNVTMAFIGFQRLCTVCLQPNNGIKDLISLFHCAQMDASYLYKHARSSVYYISSSQSSVDQQ